MKGANDSKTLIIETSRQKQHIKSNKQNIVECIYNLKSWRPHQNKQTQQCKLNKPITTEIDK